MNYYYTTVPSISSSPRSKRPSTILTDLIIAGEFMSSIDCAEVIDGLKSSPIMFLFRLSCSVLTLSRSSSSKDLLIHSLLRELDLFLRDFVEGVVGLLESITG